MGMIEAKGLIDKASAFFKKFEDQLSNQCKLDGKISVPKMDEHQLACYDLSWGAALLFGSNEMLAYPEKVKAGPNSLEEKLSLFFIADVLNDFHSRFRVHAMNIGVSPSEYDKALGSDELFTFIQENYNEKKAVEIANAVSENNFGNYGLNEDQTMMMDAFRNFAEDKVKPLAEKIHREDLTIPEEIITGLSEMGCFGLSIPDTYGGFQVESNPDNTSMAVVTEELSRASVGAAGSLITRPEIVSKALLEGGTDEQKQKWLPAFASGEKLCAVAVTEPDYGSDVAGIKVTAKETDGGWLINGTKTWCTFAGRSDVLMLLCRTNPDMSLKHKGLSILLAEKPTTRDHEFSFENPKGGKMSGKAISTIGYRGMHSYEVSFEDFFVPEENLIGGKEGLGKGFYLQMAGFAGGRLQTAARATGVMQSALEKAVTYAQERKVFKTPIFNYGLTQFKIARMAAIVQAVRQMTQKSAQLIDKHEGNMEASLVKFYSCRISEWVTREAMQIHGGMGYAEEYEISRLFVDARVFSIFEGAEEVLALRVIARSLLSNR